MSHPLTMLTSGSPMKVEQGSGGTPRLVAADVAAACAILRGPLEYWSVLVMVTQQHPGTEQAERIVRAMQNHLLHVWVETAHPRSMRAELVRPIVECAWAEHCTAQGFTQNIRARFAGMGVDNWRKHYDRLYCDLLEHVQRVAVQGMRRVSKQLRDSPAKEHVARAQARMGDY